MRECARVAAERADAAHEVAVLERGGTLRHDVIAAQGCRDAAANDSTVRRAHERHGQRSQLRKARKGVTQRGSGSGKRCVALVRVWVAARREVRAGAAKHYRTHRSATRGVGEWRETSSAAASYGFGVQCGQPWVVKLDDGHAVRLVHQHAHQARPRSARGARPERAHHHECAVGGGGRQLGVAAGQKRWWQGG
eukprot:scaffold7297_cov69-Phaeocystis_antarctica.AAC.2